MCSVRGGKGGGGVEGLGAIPCTPAGVLPGKVWTQGETGSQSVSQFSMASPDARWHPDPDCDCASLLTLASPR